MKKYLEIARKIDYKNYFNIAKKTICELDTYDYYPNHKSEIYNDTFRLYNARFKDVDESDIEVTIFFNDSIKTINTVWELNDFPLNIIYDGYKKEYIDEIYNDESQYMKAFFEVNFPGIDFDKNVKIACDNRWNIELNLFGAKKLYCYELIKDNCIMDGGLTINIEEAKSKALNEGWSWRLADLESIDECIDYVIDEFSGFTFMIEEGLYRVKRKEDFYNEELDEMGFYQMDENYHPYLEKVTLERN